MPVHYPRHSPAFLKLRTAVRQFVTAEPVTIGLSGGADSLSLVAAALVEGVAVSAVVVDHGLQSGSAQVAQRAASIAQDWGAEASVVPVHVSGDGGMEAAARQARYAALSSLGRPIWTAHTMDDQAETYLLGALRGNPAGMLQVSTWEDTPLMRPLLGVRRADTLQACAELNVQPWHDPHNEVLDYRRVAIRKQAIPLLADIAGGSVVPALAQAATRAALQSELVAELANPHASISELSAMHPAVRQASIAAKLVEAEHSVSAAVITAVEQLVINWNGQGAVAVGGSNGNRVWLGRKGDQLVFSDGKTESS